MRARKLALVCLLFVFILLFMYPQSIDEVRSDAYVNHQVIAQNKPDVQEENHLASRKYQGLFQQADFVKNAPVPLGFREDYYSAQSVEESARNFLLEAKKLPGVSLEAADYQDLFGNVWIAVLHLKEGNALVVSIQANDRDGCDIHVLELQKDKFSL
ncbi:MAG: hypothetical protein Q4E22_06655 [Coriobacteriia bacterium]|nr:hypothetical protein [Coriobacteriia bacterium]